MHQASEHLVQLAALNQNAQMPNKSPSPAGGQGEAAANNNRQADDMVLDNVPGSQEETACQGAAQPASAGQADAPATSPQLCNQDIVVPLIAVVHRLMGEIADVSLKTPDAPVSQHTLDRVRQAYHDVVKSKLKPLNRAAKRGSKAQVAAAQAAGDKPSQQGAATLAPAQHNTTSRQASQGAHCDNTAAELAAGNRQAPAAAESVEAHARAGSAGLETGDGAKQHEAVLPDQAVAMEVSALPNGGAAAREQTVVEEANRPAGPQDSAAPERRPAQATGNLLQKPASGEHAVIDKHD